MDLGLEQAGIHQLIACDFDKFCRETIKSNKPNLPVIEDILDYTADDIRNLTGLGSNESPNLIVGGPPCQAFSTAGKRESFRDERGNVFLYFLQLSLDLKPDYFVIENVRGLLSASMKHRPTKERGSNFPPLVEAESPGTALRYILDILESQGYKVSFNLYNAANYGVPQKRERVILIASKNNVRVPHLKPTNAEKNEFNLKPWKTFREAVAGLEEKDAISAKFSDNRLQYYKMLKAGQYWKHLPTEEIKKEAMGNSYFAGGGKTGFYRRLDWDKPSPTLVTHPAMPATDLAHPTLNRPLSVQEYKRLQQFPDDWEIKGPVTEQYKQIGNAVPVGLGKAVGQAIVDHINGSIWDEKEYMGFRYSRYMNCDEIMWAAKHPKREPSKQVLLL